MNRFKIQLGSEQGFFDIWKQHESYLDEVPEILEEFFPEVMGNTGQGQAGNVGTGKPKPSLMEQLDSKASRKSDHQATTTT
jgi:hypothetical protein